MAETEKRIENYKVVSCRAKCIGHTHEAYIELFFGNFVVKINPRAKWVVQNEIVEKMNGFKDMIHPDKKDFQFVDGNRRMPFHTLFEVFDIPSIEDGAYFDQITGKYCRVHFEDDRPIAIQHITNSTHVYINELEGNSNAQ